jgi:hypothetical protein
MFDFWKEVIINSDDRLEAVKNAAGESLVRVKRCADYNPKNVVDGIMYKTECVEGVCASVNLKGLINAESRVAIELGLSVGQDSEFARPWSAFKKPFIVEAKDEASLIAAIREAVPAHIGHVETTLGGDGKTITAAKLVINDPKVCVKSVKTATFDATANDWAALEEKESVITSNVVPVGTGEWILENLRFPTHVNTRVAAPNADDMPVAGGKYTQYAFEYCVSKRGAHGSGAVGQPLASVTHHVFYVLEGVDASVLEGLVTAEGLITIPENEKAYSTVRYGKVVGNEAALTAPATSPVKKDNE